MEREGSHLGWDNSETALRYAEHAQRHPMYNRLAERLVQVAGIAPGMVAVDLACGTGVLTLEICRRLGGKGRVIGVDASEAMLQIANRTVQGHQVSWIHSNAERLAQIVTPRVDAILCSAAIWQLPTDAVFPAVRALLKSDGVFAFNLPRPLVADRFPAESKPSLAQRIISIAVLDHQHVMTPRTNTFTIHDMKSLAYHLETADLLLESMDLIELATDAESEIDWWRIPIFTEQLLPEYDYATRMSILEKAVDGYEHSAAETPSWISFRCRPR